MPTDSESPPEPQTSSSEGEGAEVVDIYAEMRELARRAVQRNSTDGLFDPTDVVNECCLKLLKSQKERSLTRAQLLALAAAAIRTMLVDHARETQRLKRGGGAMRVTLSGVDVAESESLDVLDVDSALVKLARLDRRMARVVELKFFGGMQVDEIARAMEISPRTVDSEWSIARAWLHRELTQQGEPGL